MTSQVRGEDLELKEAQSEATIGLNQQYYERQGGYDVINATKMFCISLVKF